MLPSIEASLIRVCDEQGRTKGTGFVVSSDLAVTCAHVVELCGVMPGGRVHVEFHATSDVSEMTVVPELWRPRYKDDVAFLLLPARQAFPEGVLQVLLGAADYLNGHPMQTAGFAELPGGYKYSIAHGRLSGLVPHANKESMLQMDARPIWRGMSGSPVLDMTTQRVVGIVNEFLPDAPLQWATTTNTLKKIFPRLQLLLPYAVEAYLDAVAKFCHELPYVSLERDIQIKAVYVHQLMIGTPNVSSKHGNRSYMFRDAGSAIGIQDALYTRSQILLIGEPGGGKSTLMRHLIQEFCGIELRQPLLPILISLRGLADQIGTLSSCLKKQIEEELHLIAPVDLDDDFLVEWPNQTGSSWLIALDGLDEIVDASSRVKIIRELTKAAWPENSRIIVTTRPTEVVGLVGSFTPFELLPFDARQVKEFSEKWFRDKPEMARAFLNRVSSSRLRELSGNPLLLTVAATVFEKTGSVGFRRSRLYDEFVRVLLEEDASPSRRMKQQFREGFGIKFGEELFDSRREVLQSIALSIQEDQDVPAALANLFRQQPFGRTELTVTKDADRVLEILADQRTRLVNRRGASYDFIHPTFREYLVAELLLRSLGKDQDGLWQGIVSRWSEKKWREIVLFALCMIDDEQAVTSFIDRILNSGESGVFFAAACLIEQVPLSRKFRNAILDNLLMVTRAIGRTSSLSEANPITILSELSEYPRAMEALLLLARDDQMVTRVREQAAMALGRLGRIGELMVLVCDAAIKPRVRESAFVALKDLRRSDELLTLALDEGIPSSLRDRAAHALKELGENDKVIKAWQALAKSKNVDVISRESAIVMLHQTGRAEEAAEAWLTLAREPRVETGARLSIRPKIT